MTLSNQLSFSRKNAIFLGLCLAGLLLLVGIGILPLSAQQKALDLELEQVHQKLRQQDQNQADIIAVDNILSQLEQQPTPQVVTMSPLPQSKTNQINDDFRSMANEVSLAIDSIDPLLDNKTDWKSLSVRIKCYGEINQLRLLLLKLLSLPYVRQIDKIEIHPGTTSLQFTLTYTIDLA